MTTSTPRLITAEEASATHRMLRVVSFAETIHAISPSDEAGTDLESFDEAVQSLAKLGIAQHASRLPRQDRTARQMARLADAVLSVIEDSPIPHAEWHPLTDLLGDELPSLLGISASSLDRYRSEKRRTPDAVAARLHVIAQIVSDLSGSYNSFGIRRWFTRPRHALAEGRAPKDVLSGDWAPDDPDVLEVRELARALLGATIG